MWAAFWRHSLGDAKICLFHRLGRFSSGKSVGFCNGWYKGARNLLRSSSSNTGPNGGSTDKTTQVKSVDNKTTNKGERTKRLFKPPPDVNYNRKYYQNTFISATRAMSDYLLKPSDLEGLKTTAVRSAYSDQQPPDVCYLKSDVEKRAYEIWGGPEGLATEIWNRKKAYEESERYRKGLGALIGHLKKTIRDHSKKKEENKQFGERTQRNMMLKGSAKVVTYAICSNLAVMMFKFGAYLYTGSATMLSESIHSLADMLNQINCQLEPVPDIPAYFAPWQSAECMTIIDPFAALMKCLQLRCHSL